MGLSSEEGDLPWSIPVEKGKKRKGKRVMRVEIGDAFNVVRSCSTPGRKNRLRRREDKGGGVRKSSK